MSVTASAEIMGMPIRVHLVDSQAGQADALAIFNYFQGIDRQFSPFLSQSETERMNRGELQIENASPEMQEVVRLCNQTTAETRGYFDACYSGRFDPCGVVKGFAISHAARFLVARGLPNFFVDAGGDIQTKGLNGTGQKWRVGIRDPFMRGRLFGVLHASGEGVATSGCYERGQHIFDPVHGRPANAVASVTVVARDVCDADRFATAAFAMGVDALEFISSRPGLEGFVIHNDRTSEFTSGFRPYLDA